MFTNNLSPIIFNLGPLSIRWYGLFFAVGLILNYFYLNWIFKRENKQESDLESVTLYLFFGMLLGARLGHVFFYEAEYYLSNPIEIFKIWNGGLASHGAAIGILVAYLIWTKIHKIKFEEYAGLLVLGIPLTSAFVRIGNFFNSEIIGKPTDGTFGVIFKKLGEDFPRHPTQFYEAGLNLLIFLILYLVYKHNFIRTDKSRLVPRLFILFLYVFLYFTTRFLVEFFKERYYVLTDFPLSMGQVLSILPILISVAYFLFFYKKEKQIS